MDFSEFSSVTTIGLESAACLLLIVIAYKIFKMKIHSKSGCCGEKGIGSERATKSLEKHVEGFDRRSF